MPGTHKLGAGTLATSAKAKQPKDLSCGTILCYANFFLSVNSFWAVYQTTRAYVYRDNLKMRLGVVSWIIVAVKCLDLASGAIISHCSDHTTSRWGRRRPYIMVAWPCAMVVWLLMSAGGFFFRDENPDYACSELVQPNASGSGDCPALRACLETAMAEGRVPAFDAASPNVGRGEAGVGVGVYFFVVYFFYFLFFVSGSVLVYDALGQELTGDYDRRGQLFAAKSLMGMVGGIVGSLLIGVVYGMYDTDSVMASTVTTVILVVYGMVAYGVLLWGVRERPAAAPAAGAPPPVEVPFCVAVMRLMRNPPYRWYLAMKVPITFLGQLPYQLVLMYYQNNMRMESSPGHLSVTQQIAIGGALLSIPLQLQLSQKIGRKNTMTVMLAVLGSLFFVATFIPVHEAPWLLWGLGLFLGVCLTLPNVIPDAILGDIIDYDELLTGTRSEAMYTMVETNIQQGIELIISCAFLFMALAGHEPIGGCDCGCGVSCPVLGMKHARWVCPGSVGYACDEAIGASLLFEPEPDDAPCALQNSAVQWVTSIFFCAIPGASGLLAIPFVRRAVIEPAQLDAIRAGIAALKADPSASVDDPLRGGKVTRVDNSAATLLRDHFTPYEWATLAQSGAAAGLKQLRSYLSGRLAFWATCLLAFAVANAAVGATASQAASETLLQITFILLAVFMVAVPLDAFRLRAAIQGAAAGTGTATTSTAGGAHALSPKLVENSGRSDGVEMPKV